MAPVRILVDGYSLLHKWPQLAPGRARHSERAREALAHILTRFHDATGTPVTIFFDGAGGRTRPRPEDAQAPVEVLFSRAGQTADQLIERATHRFAAYGQVLVVTDDGAERDVVSGLGGLTATCAQFIGLVQDALTALAQELHHHNRTERHRYTRTPQ